MLRFAFVISITFFTYAGFCQEITVDAEFKQADRQTRLGNYETALEHVEIVLQQQPHNLEALERKVNIFILMQKDKEILKEINNNIALFPQQPEYYYLRAMVWIFRGKPKNAIEDLNNSIYYEIPLKYQDKIYLSRGTAYYHYGDFGLAEKDFEQAITINPRNSTVYQGWGMLKYEEGNYEEAIRLFNKALQISGDNAITYYNLGMAYYKQDQMPEACYNFNRSCNNNNKNACKIYFLECKE